MKSKQVKGSMTIEMTYIMPVILLVFAVTIYCTFYLYDKNILCAIAYEGVVIGKNQYATATGIEEEELEKFPLENGENRLLFFVLDDVKIEVEEDAIGIDLHVEKGIMGITVSQSMPLVEQEAYVRKMRLLKELTM